MPAPRELLERRLLHRNPISRDFFDREADGLARVCRQMAQRFSRGGRLLAFGIRSGVTDAQHVAVEFVHPVIVGKRALPARDVSSRYCAYLAALAGPDDIVMGFDPTCEDVEVAAALVAAQARGVLTFGLASRAGDYAIAPIDADAFVHQEMVEILYHTLWETVHVFLEHAALGHDAGAAGFLYPFLGSAEQSTDALVADVAHSIRSKALDDERLREDVADREGDRIVTAVAALRQRIAAGGQLLMLGNGGSATDATDWALDCVDPPKGHVRIPALSLAEEPATISAIANDVGQESVFVRQLIAHGRSRDAVIAITTSGSSANVASALVEARKRGLLTLALTGYDGGDIAKRGLADVTIVVRSDYIPRIQEVQASIYHVMTDMLASTDAAAAERT